MAPGAEGGPGSTEGQPDVIRERVASLAKRLESEPGDGDGWAMLGRSYQTLGDKRKAKEAYGKAAKLKPKDVGILMGYAESLLADGPDQDALADDFVAVMRQVLVADESHPDALYYVGLAEAQSGRKAEARALWTRLLKTLSPKSQEYEALVKEIETLGPAR